MPKANNIGKAAQRIMIGTERVLDIPKLAAYLSITTWRAEELLREGRIKFKVVAERKLVDRKDADSWWEQLPYSNVTVLPKRGRIAKVGSTREDKYRRVGNGSRPLGPITRAEIVAMKRINGIFVIGVH
jgi:hypothetical protein